MHHEIEGWRTEIDEIDRQLLELLNARAKAALRIGTIKRMAGIPIFDRKREDAVLSRLRAENSGPLSEQAIDRLFTRIIHESRMLEGEALPSAVAEGGNR